MSDLQILTGLSILISGFAQFPSSLQCYHLQILVNLAWFSSLTHLACLSFLRNYLYHRPGERAWRIGAMGVFIAMLIVGIVPTGSYNWYHGAGIDRPFPQDYATCYFQVRPKENVINGDIVLASMVLSVLLVVLGFVSRVIRLYETLSVGIVGKARSKVSKSLRAILRQAYRWCDTKRSPNGLRRQLIYRPLLAVFLLLQVVSELWTSMFIEVRTSDTIPPTIHLYANLFFYSRCIGLQWALSGALFG